MSEHRLDELVIERPRSGMRLSSTYGFRKTVPLNDYEHPDYETFQPRLIKPKRTKHFSDHLGPLRRYLYSHVGEPWNDVYSDLCQRLTTQTLSGQHILSHVWFFVERYVEMVDGLPYHKASSRWGRWVDRPLGYWRTELYVHPDTGLLCEAKPLPPAPKPTNPDLRVIDRYHQYQRIQGVWFSIHFQAFGSHLTRFDLLQRTIITHSEAVKLYGHALYVSQKRQCSKKELKQLSLPRL